MCNCGNKRQEYARPLSTGPSSEDTMRRMWPDIPFEYMGETGMTVRGSVTGKVYRFNFKGDRQTIDYRDAGNFRSVPNLRRAEEI